MPRFFTVILLLAVFFLTGMVFGMNQENINNLTPSHKAENKLNDQPNNSIQNEKTSPTNSEYATDYNDELDSQKPTKALTLTQKTASLLEKGIKGISEIIVGILHQIALLFF